MMESGRAAVLVRDLIRMLNQANVRHAAETSWGVGYVRATLEGAEALAQCLEKDELLSTSPPTGARPLPKYTIEEIMAIGILAVCEEIGMLRDNQVRQAYQLEPAHGEDIWSKFTVQLQKMLEERGVIHGQPEAE